MTQRTSLADMTQWPLEEFLDQLAAVTPSPGGGAVTALTAAMAAALTEMCVGYSLQRKQTPRRRQRLKRAGRLAKRYRMKFLQAAVADALAYARVSATQARGGRAYRAALKRAKEVPYRMAQWCYELLEVMPDVVSYGSPYLISDVEVAVEMLFCAHKTALIHVKVNDDALKKASMS